MVRGCPSIAQQTISSHDLRHYPLQDSIISEQCHECNGHIQRWCSEVKPTESPSVAQEKSPGAELAQQRNTYSSFFRSRTFASSSWCSGPISKTMNIPNIVSTRTPLCPILHVTRAASAPTAFKAGSACTLEVACFGYCAQKRLHHHDRAL